MNPFNWLRSLARAAVLNGISDALEEVTVDPQEPISDLAALQARLAAAARVPELPAAEVDEQPAAKRGRKGGAS